MRWNLLSLVLVLAACTPTPTPVPPSPPDASDAATMPETATLQDAQATGPCAAACAHLLALGCVQLSTCATTLANVEAHRLVANPAHGGEPLTCADVLGADSPSSVKAIGWSCGP